MISIDQLSNGLPSCFSAFTPRLILLHGVYSGNVELEGLGQKLAPEIYKNVEMALGL